MIQNKSKYAGLASGTALYMVGTALSKILNFVILPYISQMVSSEQFGIYDAIQTIAGLLVPVVTLQAVDAAFRFMFEADDEEKSKVLTNVWLLIIFGITLFIPIGSILNKFVFKLDYFWLLVVYIVSNVFVNMFQRIARSYDMRKEYAISGIIQTIVLLLAQFLLLQTTDLNEKGLVYAYVISAVATCIYIEIRAGSIQNIRLSLLEYKLIKKIIAFSVPLVPNSISWWGVSSIGRIMIIAFIGYSANGVYSMANKFAGLVTMVTSTFLLAFQEYAITERREGGKSTYSDIFKHYMHVLSIGTGVLLLLQQIYFALFIDLQYIDAVQYIPMVMASMLFSSISSFYGTGYFVYEKTTGAFKTTILGAIVNIVLSYILIQLIGLWGIAIASMIAYMVMCVARHFSMKGYFVIKISGICMISSLVVLIIACLVFYLNEILYSIITIILLGVYTLIFYGKNIIILLKRYIKTER